MFNGTWSPHNGIVFQSAGGNARLLSTAAIEKIAQDHLLHSHAEDNYVMASASMSILEDRQSCIEPKAVTATSSKLVSALNAKGEVGVGEKRSSSEEGSAHMSEAGGATRVQQSRAAEPEDTTAVGSKEDVATHADLASIDTTPREIPGKAAWEDQGSRNLHEPVITKGGSTLQDLEPPQERELDPEDPKYHEPPETPTAFKMDPELFRQAKNAEPESKGSYWSHALYRSPDMVHGIYPSPKVHYCKTILASEKVLKEHFSSAQVVGFDIEWKENSFRSPNPRDHVSLIQLASESRIALLHIAVFPTKDGGRKDLVPPTLKRIMEDPLVTKVGIAIRGDCTRVKKWMGIDSRSLIELSHLYKLVKFSQSKEFTSINRRLVSLATQAKEHLHLPMFKGDVRVSDWRQHLTYEQVQYGASDAYAGFQLYHTLEMKRKRLDPVPPRPFFAELGLPIRFADGVEIPSADEADDEEITVEQKKEGTRRRSTRRAGPKATESTGPENEVGREAALAEQGGGKSDHTLFDVSYLNQRRDRGT